MLKDDQQVQQLEQRVREIEERNRKVEADKTWETSWQRKLIIAGLTYGVIVILFWFADITKPFINAVVPTVAFMLSTWSVPMFRRWWLRRERKKSGSRSV